MSISCRFYGKSFSPSFHLTRHESQYCPLQEHNPLIQSGCDQSVGMSTKRRYADSDSTSESDLDHLDHINEDLEVEYKINPWASLKT